MPLCLTFKQGEDFFIGPDQWRVVAIYGHGGCRVRHEPNGARFDINERAVTIGEGVQLCTSLRQSPRVVCLSIDAPRTLLVLRGRKYRAAKRSGLVLAEKQGSYG